MHGKCASITYKRQVVIDGEELGAHVDQDKTVAKEGAARRAMAAMAQHLKYAKQFLIKVRVCDS